MDQIPQHKTTYTKRDRRESSEKHLLIGTGEEFLNRTPIMKELIPYDTEKLLQSKGQYHPEKAAAYEIGKDFYQFHI